MYDPALGRFHCLDPMTVFTPGISPYTYADDDPVNNIDYYGLGKEDRERRKMERANNRRKRKAHRDAQPKGRGEKYDPHFKNEGTNPPRPRIGTAWVPRPPRDYREPLGPFPTLDPISGIIPTNYPGPNIIPEPPRPNLPDPSFPIGNAGERVPFTRDIYFTSSSDGIYDIPHNIHVLNDLVKTLQDFDKVKLYIYGNIDLDGGITGHSEDALKQGVRYNGKNDKASNLMRGRARAVYNYLIDKGIDPKRLDYRIGNVYDSGGSAGMKVTFESVNP